VIARNDRLKANLQTSNIELQLLEARNNYNIANINMDLLLGLPETTEIEVDQNYIEEGEDVKPVDFYVNAAKENRKDLQALDKQRQAAAIGNKSGKSGKPSFHCIYRRICCSRYSEVFNNLQCRKCRSWNFL
jgi:outer membrane protein TolC